MISVSISNYSQSAFDLLLAGFKAVWKPKNREDLSKIGYNEISQLDDEFGLHVHTNTSIGNTIPSSRRAKIDVNKCSSCGATKLPKKPCMFC